MKLIKSGKLAFKLILCFVIVACFVGLIGILGMSNMSIINSNGMQIYQRNLTYLNYLQEINSNTLRIALRAFNLAGLKDASKAPEAVNEIKRLRKENDDMLKAYESNVSEEQADTLKKLKDDLIIYRATVDKAVYLTEQGRFDDALVQSKIIEQSRETLNKSINVLISFEKAEAENANAHNKEIFQDSYIQMRLIAILAFVVALAMGILISLSLARKIGKVVVFAQRLGEGDLTQQIHVKSKDEIGILVKALNKAAESIRQLIAEVISSTAGLSASSEEILATTEELSSKFEVINASTATISKSAEDLSSTIQQINASAEEITASSTNLT